MDSPQPAWTQLNAGVCVRQMRYHQMPATTWEYQKYYITTMQSQSMGVKAQNCLLKSHSQHVRPTHRLRSRFTVLLNKLLDRVTMCILSFCTCCQQINNTTPDIYKQLLHLHRLSCYTNKKHAHTHTQIYIYIYTQQQQNILVNKSLANDQNVQLSCPFISATIIIDKSTKTMIDIVQACTYIYIVKNW